MPSHKSALKRVKQTEKRTLRNKSIKTSLKTIMKEAEDALEGGENDKIRETFAVASPAIDKAASKGVMHKNTAARKKSRLAKKVNAALA